MKLAEDRIRRSRRSTKNPVMVLPTTAAAVVKLTASEADCGPKNCRRYEI